MSSRRSSKIMNKNKKDDKINAELSKTFFQKSPDTKPAKKSKNKPKDADKNNRILLKAAVIIMLGLTVAFAFLILPKTQAPAPDATYKTRHASKRPPIPKVISVIPDKPPLPVSDEKETKTFYDFETSDQGWEIPLWAQEKPDHVAEAMVLAKGFGSRGKGCLQINANFPGERWTAALIEISQYLDLTNFDDIYVDIYVPEACPRGLRAKIIFTVGEDWKWIEMSRNIPLVPGEWTTVKASLAEGSFDWRRITVDKAFKEDVRKIAIRIESNNRPVYQGPIYIDNIRLTPHQD